jgi:hypothetical protein
VDPGQIRDLATFQDYERLMQARRIQLLTEMEAQRPTHRPTDWQRSPITEEFINQQLEHISHWLDHEASDRVGERYRLPNPEMATLVRQEFARRLRRIASEEGRRAQSSSSPERPGYRGPAAGYPLDPLHIYMDTVVTLRHALSENRGGREGLRLDSVRTRGAHSFEIPHEFPTLDQILNETREGNYQERRDILQVWYPSGTLEETSQVREYRIQTPEERETLPSARSIVFAPRTISQLIAVRTRAHTGIFELAHYFPELRVNKSETNHRTLIALFKEPRLWSGLLIYCCVNILARCRASIRCRTGASVWERDNTSRVTIP